MRELSAPVRGNAHGKAVSAIAKAHGKEVSAAARARAAERQAAGKANGNANSKANAPASGKANASAHPNGKASDAPDDDTAPIEPGRIKVVPATPELIAVARSARTSCHPSVAS